MKERVSRFIEEDRLGDRMYQCLYGKSFYEHTSERRRQFCDQVARMFEDPIIVELMLKRIQHVTKK